MKFQGYKFYLLVIRDVFVLKHPLYGVHPLKEVIQVELAFELWDFHIEINGKLLVFPCSSMPPFLYVITCCKGVVLGFFFKRIGFTSGV